MTRKTQRRQFLQSGALVGMAALAGCTGGSGGNNSTGNNSNKNASGNNSSTGGTDSGSSPTVAFCVPSLELTFFARAQNAFNQAKSNGAISSASSFYDAGGSQSTQVSNIETAITNDVDFLMLVAITSEGVSSAVQQANEANVPVIAIDRSVAQGETVTYIASDNVRLGKRSTILCQNFMQNSSDSDTYNIVQIEGTQGASTTNARGKGFKNAVSNNENLNQLASQTGEFTTQAALSVMEDFITQYGDQIDGVFCQNDLMAVGAHQALQSSNLSVPVTGIDGSEAWVKLFSDNQYYGTIAQLPEKMVTTGIQKGKAYLADKDVKDTISIKGLEVTQENASKYLNQYFS